MPEKIVPTPRGLVQGAIEGEVLSSAAVYPDTLAQKTSQAILQLRLLTSQLIRGDGESRRLILEYFREGVERRYLDASIGTDRARLDNFREQIGLANEGISTIVGKDTTIVDIYREVSEANPGKYKPLLTKGKFDAEGLFDFLRFHQELATRILSVSEVSSEAAEIEAQTALVKLRGELERLKIGEAKDTAEELSDARESLVDAAVAQGEIRVSKIRGYTRPILTIIGEFPIVVFQAPVDRLAKWMDESEDKAVPIVATGGAIAGPILLFSKVAASSSIIEKWLSENVVYGSVVGVFGGALVSVAAWGSVRYIALPALGNIFGRIKGRVENLRRNRRAGRGEVNGFEGLAEDGVPFPEEKDEKGLPDFGGRGGWKD